MKKKLLINALSAQLGGGQTYLLQLFSSQHKIWDDYEIVFLVSEKNAPVFQKNFSKVINIGPVGDNLFSRFYWENKNLARLVKTEKVDLLFSPGGLLPFFLTGVKTICVSQNMLPFTPKQILESENFSEKIKFVLLRLFYGFSFNKADAMIFLSQFAHDVISKAAGPFKTTKIIPHGTSTDFSKPQKSPFEFPYLLYVSTFFTYKHQLEVVQAFYAYLKQNPRPLKLVFVGSNQNRYAEKVKQLIKKLNLEDQIVMMGNVSHETLPALMKNSEANIFASSCENCPIILLEYMAAQRPVLCSDLEPMKEFGKNMVTYFSPYNPDELTTQLIKVLDQKVIPEPMSIDEIKALSWSKTATSTKEFIETVLSR